MFEQLAATESDMGVEGGGYMQTRGDLGKFPLGIQRRT